MEDNKKQKREELMNKAAEAMGDGAKKLDQLIDKRSALGELSAPLTLGVIVMLVVALANNTNLLLVGALGVAVGFAPKIVKMVLAKKHEMDAKKASQPKVEAKKDEDKKV